MAQLDGKVAIITGAGSGIGRAAALLFAQEGAKVVVADIVVESGHETVKMIKQASNEAMFVKADVSRTEDVKKMIKAAVDTHGKLNILYNNAGVAERENVPLHECKQEDFDRVIAVNLKGVFLGMKYAIPEMLKVGGGVIINQGSTAGIQGRARFVSYCTSKGGVAAMSRAAAADYVRQGIRVNWIEPAFIATPMVTRDLTKGNKKSLKKLESAQPLGRFGTAEEVANLALFLASDASSYITGTGVKIDGATTQAGAFW